MTWQWATGLPVGRTGSYLAGFRMRWLRGDMRWLRDNFRRTGRPDSMTRARALWAFTTEFARTIRYDCFDWRDLRPMIAEFAHHRRVGAPRDAGPQRLPRTCAEGIPTCQLTTSSSSARARSACRSPPTCAGSVSATRSSLARRAKLAPARRAGDGSSLATAR